MGIEEHNRGKQDGQGKTSESHKGRMGIREGGCGGEAATQNTGVKMKEHEVLGKQERGHLDDSHLLDDA